MFDPLRLYHAELCAMLGAGETPLAAVLCQAAFGADRLERSPDELAGLLRLLPDEVRQEVARLLPAGPAAQPDQQAWERALDKVQEMFHGWPDLFDADVERAIGGVAASGAAGSCAHRLSTALKRASAAHCVVSDRRVVVATRASDSSFHEVAALPRQAVLTARRAGRFLQRGRVVLDFADLSQLAVMTGMIFTGPARRLEAALRGGAMPS